MDEIKPENVSQVKWNEYKEHRLLIKTSGTVPQYGFRTWDERFIVDVIAELQGFIDKGFNAMYQEYISEQDGVVTYALTCKAESYVDYVARNEKAAARNLAHEKERYLLLKKKFEPESAETTRPIKL